MENKRNNLAIVIPAYKSTFLPAALDSITAQTCQDFTLYIGDDCSPHNLGEIVERYRDRINLVYKRFDTNLGGKDLVAQWERCIDMTNGEEWIWLFSDDDVMEKNCVANFYKSLQDTNASYDLYHFDVRIIDDSGKVTNIPNAYPQDLDNFSYYEGKLRGKYASLVVENIFSRRVYRKYDGFKKFDLAWGSDTATWVLFSEKKGFHTISNSYILWRCGNQNISPNVSKLIVERKVRALVEFFNWSHLYFKKRHQAHLLTNVRAFISRIVMFSQYVPGKMIDTSIRNFCAGHGIIFIYPFVRILVKLKK